MAVNSRHLPDLTAGDVWSVLADGETYGYWVVGTRAVREISGDWPEPGSSLHYTVGYLPLRKDDRTDCVDAEPQRRLTLEAHAWPIGTMHIELQLLPAPRGVTVTIEEHPKTGVLKTLHNPLVDLAIKARNVETLRRLETCARDRVQENA